MARPPASPDPNRPRRKRKPTATSNFGVSRRESHDASAFYARFTTPTLDLDDEVRPSTAVDEVFCGDSRNMVDVADKSVALVVTSPPYFAGKEYEEALGEGHIPDSYLAYLEMLTEVFAECVRVLEPGGRIAVNVANLGRKPYRSLSADVIAILQDRLGLWLRAEILWQKGKGANGSCAWGSYRQPSNPVLRDVTERIVVASKGRLDRAVKRAERARRGLPATASITRDEFLEATLDVWELPTESATRVAHPAPYPVELPQRLIELYTYEGDVVLDPFVGSGTTAVAAVRTGRRYVGFDTDPDYVEIARKRAAEEVGRVMAAEAAPPLNPAGTALVDLAVEAVEAAGFTDVRKDVRLPGGLVFIRSARDAKGRLWLFDVAGGFTTATNGLRRSDLVWRTLGRAAAAKAQDRNARVVVFTSALPKRGSAGHQALAASYGSTLVDALIPTDPDAVVELARLAAGRPSRHKK
jgi:site-specific DNA-methyltransferase (adenine-specific)